MTYEVGQKVVVNNGAGYYGIGKPYDIYEVTKITATQITLSDGNRYMIRDGMRVGDGSKDVWSSRSSISDLSIEEAEKRIAEWKHSNWRGRMLSKINNAKFTDVSDEQLKQIWSILEPHQPKEG